MQVDSETIKFYGYAYAYVALFKEIQRLIFVGYFFRIIVVQSSTEIYLDPYLVDRDHVY